MDKNEFIAHITEDGREQTVKDHLLGTAKRAEGFAAAFDAADAGFFAGAAHDIGKYSQAFQQRIRGGDRCDHSTAGAIECARRGADWAACAVMGHHSGLPDMGNLGDAPGKPTYFGRLKNGLQPGRIPDYAPYWCGDLPLPPVLAGWGQDAVTDSFLIRMLYSCLVDADFLDTEQFMLGDTGRGGYDELPVLEQRLIAYEAENKWDKPKGDLNRKRSEILQACRGAGKLPRGLYTLTVPTGGGKTVASLAFALRHAIENKMDRVIYIVPYTSIIEQNAQKFRDILGDNNVLEHHAGSLADMNENPTPEQRRKSLAAENWDAPVVVTTAVRFFEAMYANRSSKCRRLHNLANSVLIFDEAQMLPLEHLKPCVAAIAQLVKNFRATAVLCTATQPALNALFRPYGLAPAELCPGAAAMAGPFRRVTFRFAGQMDMDALAAELSSCKQALCIVNTRKQAAELFAALPGEGRYHLSTLMCPAHRRAVLDEIRGKLKAGEPCRVVSTSLVEAGVDVDFPAVYRERAGLDSILQAAGRCNREGKKSAEDSVVTVFESTEEVPPLFQANVRAAREALKNGADPDAPEAVERYFRSLFDLRGEQSMDRCGVLDAFQHGIEGCAIPFQTVAEGFHLIANDTKTVYIPRGEGKALTERLLAGERSRALYRRAGQFSVSVYPQHFKDLAPALAPLDEDSAVLIDQELYSELTGLSLEADEGKALFG